MNAAHAVLFPPAVVIVQEAPQVDVEARHQEMIRGSAAIHDVCLEDLSPENMSILMELVDQFRSNLIQCQASVAVTPEAQTG